MINNLFHRSACVCRRIKLTLIISIASIAVYLSPLKIQEALVYNRTTILSGEIWRIFTGHFLHCDLGHLMWNIVAFLLIAGTLESNMSSYKFLKMIIMGAAWLSVGLLLLKTSLQLYCGLSGVLNFVLVILLFEQYKSTRHLIYPFIFILAIAKVIFEYCSTTSLFTSTSWESIPEAHFLGLGIGIIYSIISKVK